MALLDLTSNNLTDPIINGFREALPRIPAAVVAFLFGFVLIKVFSWIARFMLSFVRLPRGLRQILVSMIDGLLWVFLIISILGVLGLSKLAIVFSGSIAALGLALAAGAASLASDILAGVFLAKDRDFSLGDAVIAGENKTEGTIEAMDMRRTRIRAKDGKLHIIPNSVIERKEWVLLAKKKDR